MLGPALLLGCLERPPDVQCLNAVDCRDGLRCVAFACVPGDAGLDGVADARPEPAVDARPDTTPNARPDTTPDARPEPAVECPPAVDAAPDGPSACPPVDAGVDARCAPVPDVDEGALDCPARETPPFVVPPVDYPTDQEVGPGGRHVALASAGPDRVAVAWTDPPPVCAMRCFCAFTPDLGESCPRPEACDCPETRQALHVACLDGDLARTGADDWQRTAPQLVIGYASGYDHNLRAQAAQAHQAHQIALTWAAELERYVLTWTELDWGAYDPDAPAPGAGPGAVGVALLHADCQLDTVVTLPEDQRACAQVGTLRDPRVRHGPDGFDLICGDTRGGLCLTRAETLAELAFDRTVDRPCDGWPRSTSTWLGEQAYIVLRLAFDDGETIVRLRRADAATRRIADAADPRLDGDLARFSSGLGYVNAGIDIAPSADRLGIVWRLTPAPDCDAGAPTDSPIWFQRVDPEALLTGRSACGPLGGLPGRAQGRVVRLANADDGPAPPAVAHDPTCGAWYVTRSRPDGVWLSRLAADGTPQGRALLGPGRRSRLIVVDGRPVVARVTADGTITVAVHQCAP